MTEAEEKQKRAAILLEYHESKQALVLLRKEARDIAERLESFAKLLRTDPTRIDNPGGQLPSYKEVFDLASKVKQASLDFAEREHTAKQLGFNDL